MDRLLELVSDDNVDINWTNNGSSLTSLMCLCEKNQTEDFDRCFEAVMRRDDNNVQVTNSNYMNALHLLCQLSERLSVSAVEKFIQRGIDVKARRETVGTRYISSATLLNVAIWPKSLDC